MPVVQVTEPSEFILIDDQEDVEPFYIEVPAWARKDKADEQSV